MNAGPRNGRIRNRVRCSASSSVRRPSGSGCTSETAITPTLAGPKTQARSLTRVRLRSDFAGASGGAANQAEVGQVPVALVELESVADEELVRDREADVADGQVVDQPPVRPVEESRDVQRI